MHSEDRILFSIGFLGSEFFIKISELPAVHQLASTDLSVLGRFLIMSKSVTKREAVKEVDLFALVNLTLFCNL